MTIVLVCDTEDSTLIGLLDATHLDVRAFKISRENLCLSNNVKSFECELRIASGCNSDRMFGII